jgi:hypothetical protein
LFVLMLQVPLSFLVGPNIFLNIFLSNTEGLSISRNSGQDATF